MGYAQSVNGVTYGENNGRFRGRWWNYYQRGRAYLEDGLYEEARRDLETALEYRDRDQRWPRTYGLHFTPEYFPHRELGIVNYHEGRLEDARVELALSITQRFSARAAYYLDETRRALLARDGTDAAPPILEVESPLRGAALGDRVADVTGVARDDQFVAAIEVDGISYDVKVSAREVPFNVRVPLAPGMNDIQVSCEDLAGKRTTVRVPIVCDVDGPLISFDHPLVLPGRISGVLQDPASVVSLKVLGRSATVEDGADGVFSFTVDIDENALRAPLIYVCEDGLGNITEGLLPADLLVDMASLPDVVFASGTLQVVRFASGVRAFTANGHTIAVAAAPISPDGPPAVSMANIVEGESYFLDHVTQEMVVNLRVESKVPVDRLALINLPVDVLPGRGSFTVSRRIPLEEGPMELVAEAVDASGQRGEERKRIQGEPTELANDSNKLAIGLLSESVETADMEMADLTRYVLSKLEGDPSLDRRFTVVDRGLIDEALREQQLSSLLASKEGKLALGKLIPAELLLAATVRRDQGSVELVLEATSSELGVRLAHIDAAGPEDELDRVISDLSVRLRQEFPQVQGEVFDLDAPLVIFDAFEHQRLRPFLKCVVFRNIPIIDRRTGQPRPGPPRRKVLAEGTVDAVAPAYSTANVHDKLAGDATDAFPVQVGDIVVIK